MGLKNQTEVKVYQEYHDSDSELPSAKKGKLSQEKETPNGYLDCLDFEATSSGKKKDYFFQEEAAKILQNTMKIPEIERFSSIEPRKSHNSSHILDIVRERKVKDSSGNTQKKLLNTNCNPCSNSKDKIKIVSNFLDTSRPTEEEAEENEEKKLVLVNPQIKELVN